MNLTNFSKALAEWQTVLGQDWVEIEPEHLQLAEATTFLSRQKIPAIIYPGNTEEVSQCLKIANRYLIPLYPISAGKNWGYGSRVPVTTDSVLIDLRRMNRILELNEKLAYVTLEPGVTQLQLLTYLEEKTAGRLWLDSVASSPFTSIIGNAMERGHGTTPYCDRIAHSCNLQVVLPNGEVINTDYGMFANAKTKNVDGWGLGPAISHLFSQSNLGIVTRMTLMLYPRPEYMKIAVFSTDVDAELDEFIDWANQQRLRGILKAGPQIFNRYISLIRLLEKYPRQQMNDQTPLHQTLTDELCKEFNIKHWTVIFGLWGTPLEVTALQSEVLKTLPKTAKIQLWDYEELMRDPQLSDSRRQDWLNLFKQMAGNVTGLGLARAYWRNQRKKPEDPANIDLDKDRCGFLSINPCCPLTGEDFLSIAKLSTEIILSYGFEPNISAYATRPRLLQFHITLCFDRDNPEEDARALHCQSALMQILQEKGYYAGRLTIATMNQMDAADSAYLQVLSAIKYSLDANNILSPGRYEGRKNHAQLT